VLGDVCFFDGLVCEFSFGCLADVVKHERVAVRCSRMVFARRCRVEDLPLDRRKPRVVVV
jgi:hypothetical protein